MAAKMIENNGENAEIYTGAEVCKQKLNELLKEINIPSGLFPMVDFLEFGYNKSTGFMWLILKNPVQHKFKKMNRVVSYDKHFTAFVENHRVTKIQGLKSKEIMIWITLSDVFIDDPASGNITIANPSGISTSMPISDFEDEDER
ncbi:hypothetical protein RND81_06G082800 [Saponaria officinalis]|uniref:DUF538 domain-containing protein n=1 Tax=Saponaria officinalis TaxID=3572 RepID=A0AAW1K866_SAPOF